MAHSVKEANDHLESQLEGARSSRRRGRALVPPAVTLAFWRLRQAWGLLFITATGMIAAVTLVCAVPLYSQIAATAGLRGILSSPPSNADIVVRSNSKRISTSFIAQVTQHLDREFHKNLGPYLGTAQFAIDTQPFSLLAGAPGQHGSKTLRPTHELIQLTGDAMDQAMSHLKLVQGRLPQASGTDIEIAVSAQTASLLQLTYHVGLGSILNMRVLLINEQTGVSIARDLTLHIVGIFKLLREDDPFWQGNDFVSQAPDKGPTTYRALASTQTTLSVLERTFNSTSLSTSFYTPASLTWDYHLDPPRITVDNLDTIINSIQVVQVDNSNNAILEQYPFLTQTLTYLPASALQLYRSRITVAQLPVTSLSLLVLGLVLFFVSMMAELLIERQTNAIAILRSRGASRRQVLNSLLTQSTGLGIIALIAGPLLAIFLVRMLAQQLLAPADQSALNLINGNLLQVALRLRWYALAAVGVAVLAMVFAVVGTMRLDVLALRREAARSTHHPLWQRLNLDIIAAIIALLGYGFSVYITNSNVLDPHLRLLLLSPLTLLEAVFLLLAALLVFLRFFPRILQLGMWFTMRNRSAAPMLALAQMARAPRQPIRMTLLLALATAFAIFTFIFTASQAQRIFDVTSYQSGADFSGTMRVNFYTSSQVANAEAAYRHIPGVISASVGYTKFVNAGGSVQTIRIDFKAVDAATFAQTAIWSQQDSSQSLDNLMDQLRSQRALAASHKVVPAIVDASTWNALHLSPGSNFTLSLSTVGYTELMNFTPIAEVQHIPSSADGAPPAVLVDFQSFAAVYGKTISTSGYAISPNTVWLRTRDDAASLASARKALSQGPLQLDFLYDRRAMIADLSHEPLYLDLFGVLALGASTALLLALVGNLIASWVSARNRLSNFAILRALGASPGQIAGTLLWEQGIIYIAAIGCGVIFGAILSALVIPALVITSVASNAVNSDISSGGLYAAQAIPPVQMIVPTSLGIILGVLIVICIVALATMVQTVSRPVISQVLRLDED
jgi:ABC-type antimicrobial peptide transport system permease subunit